MARFTYEKPQLIRLSQKTMGQVAAQGVCFSGTYPGPAPNNTMYCSTGYEAQWPGATSWCAKGVNGPPRI